MLANKFIITSLLLISANLAINSALAQDQNDSDDSRFTTTEPSELSPQTTASPSTTTTSAVKPIAPITTTTTAAPTSTSTTTATTTTTTTTTTTKRPNPPDCPSACTCTQQLVDCESKQLLQLPKFDPKSQYAEFKFANNSIQLIDFRQLPLGAISSLDLSDNSIATIVMAPSKKNELAKLKVLNLSNNKLDSVVSLSSWKMPALEELSLARNRLVKLTKDDFGSKISSSLKKLDLQQQQQQQQQGGLRSIDELAFNLLIQLQHLNLSNSLAPNYHLPDQLFAKLQLLKVLDLSYNYLVEVPVALRRGLDKLKILKLNGNLMTSLRPSDFININELTHLEVKYCPQLLRVEPNTFGQMDKLTSLIISDNPRFFEFSSDSFMIAANSIDPSSLSSSSVSYKALSLLDLSANNITSMSNPMQFSAGPQISQLRLANNPWDCSCAIEWLIKLTNLEMQQPIHCRTPAKYSGLEISQYFKMVECQLEDSSLQKFVLVLFLLFLIVLTVVVFVQKSDICRRLQWRDQYGTIYYTKATFPLEQFDQQQQHQQQQQQ